MFWLILLGGLSFSEGKGEDVDLEKGEVVGVGCGRTGRRGGRGNSVGDVIYERRINNK